MSSKGRGPNELHEIGEAIPPDSASEQLPAADKKKGKIRIDSGAMDAAMYKVHSKYASEDEKQDTQAPRQASWEIDPSKLSLRQKIGEGSYGTVHRGTYDRMDVAVKILNWDKATMSAAEADYHRQKFLREVNIMSSLSHPNVTRFIGAWAGGREYEIPSHNMGSHGTFTLREGMHMLLMEFVSGGSLRSLWINARRAGRRRLGYNVVLQCALDTARGLAYLHSKQICHRDLKPDNLLLDGNLSVKIADFGESRVQASNTTDMSKSTGTYGYMAPEVMEGTVPTGYDHKCDVFSFAMVIWELYNCSVLFSELPAHLNVRDMALLISQKGLRPTIPACCPSFLKNLMKICWDADPNKRPEMKQIITMIEAQPASNCGTEVALACDKCCVCSGDLMGCAS